MQKQNNINISGRDFSYEDVLAQLEALSRGAEIPEDDGLIVEDSTMADAIYGELVKQYQPYIDATDIIPKLVPMAQQVIDNLKSLEPVYTEVNNFFKKSVQDSVLDAYKASYEACDSNVGVALELTKLIVGQSRDRGHRLNELLKASVEEAKKNSSKS